MKKSKGIIFYVFATLPQSFMLWKQVRCYVMALTVEFDFLEGGYL